MKDEPFHWSHQTGDLDDLKQFLHELLPFQDALVSRLGLIDEEIHEGFLLSRRIPYSEDIEYIRLVNFKDLHTLRQFDISEISIVVIAAGYIHVILKPKEA